MSQETHPHTRRRRRARLCLLLGLLALGVGMASMARVGWLSGKAVVAQWLLDAAWRQTLQTGHAPRPWPWADVRPVARLDVPSLDTSLVVLDNASGEALAFGPGLVAGDPAKPIGTLVVGGHRDTHLAFLADLPPGSDIVVENPSGDATRYRTGSGYIVDSSRQRIAISTSRPGLVLVTCWPFDAASAGGPLRYVVPAQPTAPNAQPNSVARAGSRYAANRLSVAPSQPASTRSYSAR